MVSDRWKPLLAEVELKIKQIEFPNKPKDTTKMTKKRIILNHLMVTGTISIREAMDDYNMSGGALTKCISELNRDGYKIDKIWYKHPITGQRYARYYFDDTSYDTASVAA
jgi:hypothetical protein